jgi:hypothetical protein
MHLSSSSNRGTHPVQLQHPHDQQQLHQEQVVLVLVLEGLSQQMLLPQQHQPAGMLCLPANHLHNSSSRQQQSATCVCSA